MKRKKIKEYDDIPYLETEEEVAENIADINERRDVIKKDNKARNFAPSDSAEKNKTNKTEKIVSDSNKDDDYKNIKIFHDDDDNIKITYHDDDDNIKISNDDGNIKISYDDNDYQLNGLDKNGLDGLKLKYRKGENNILYDQYGFDKDGFNKDGYGMYGFDKNGLNKNRFNIYDYEPKSNKAMIYKRRFFEDQKGKGYSNLPILLSKMYPNNNSKELINDIKQLVKNLYDNKQITKQVYNILNKAITYKNDS